MTKIPRNNPAAEGLVKLADPCVLCPRQCKASRASGQAGFCGVGIEPVVSSAGPHFGEEGVLVGQEGSGTIFFAGCNLGCLFCQNYEISHLCQGRLQTASQLARTMLDLQALGCVNINLVTPTHFTPPICEAIAQARDQGLRLPIVYNSGGYDAPDVLRQIEGFIDIYMPDMKYADASVATQLSQAPDYPSVNREAILEMHRQVGDLQVSRGVAVRGLLVRHLVLPNGLAGSFESVDFLANHVSPSTAINVMDQYRPCFKAHADPRLNRRPLAEEVESVRRYAMDKGLRIIE